MKELIKALVAAKKQFKPIEKDKKGARSKYATLDSVYSSIDKALLDNGLVVTQPMAVIDGQHVLQTVIWHESGQSLESDYYPITSNADPQKVGAAITYGRRYQLCAMLGITADEDTDAEGVGASAKSKATRQPDPAKVESVRKAAKESKPATIDSKQVAEFLQTAEGNGWTEDGVKGLLEKAGFDSVESISQDRFGKALAALKNENTRQQYQ